MWSNRALVLRKSAALLLILVAIAIFNSRIKLTTAAQNSDGKCNLTTLSYETSLIASKHEGENAGNHLLEQS